MSDRELRPLIVSIECCDDYPLPITAIKYTLRTLLTIAGFPHHFVHADRLKVCDIYFGRKAEHANRHQLQIEMTKVKQNAVCRPVHAMTASDMTLISYDGLEEKTMPPIHIEGSTTIVKYDIILSAFYLLTGSEEACLGRDKRDRHTLSESFLFQKGLLHIPIINQYALFIRRIFKGTYAFLPPWPKGKTYAVCLSHDVDYPEIIPSIEVGRYLKQNRLRSHPAKVKDILSGKENFFKFEEWRTLEKRYGMRSAFYFCGYCGSVLRYLTKAPDPFYDVCQKRYKKIMNSLNDDDFEIGMHSSYLAYRSEQQFRQEKENVEDSLGKPVCGNRHHYWHMDPNNPEDTAHLHQRIGLYYDSSMSFGKHSGFRRSVCSPFHLFSTYRNFALDIIQLPPTLMDDHLFGYRDTTGFMKYTDHIDALLKAVKDYEGVFVIDYHVRVLNATFFPNWGDSYEYFLKRVTACSDFYCDTPINVARHWKRRETILEESSIDATTDQ